MNLPDRVVLVERKAKDLGEARVLDALEQAGRADPASLAEIALRPFLGDARHVHHEYNHVVVLAVFFVEIAADGLGVQDADKTGLFPGFLESSLAGGLAR